MERGVQGRVSKSSTVELHETHPLGEGDCRRKDQNSRDSTGAVCRINIHAVSYLK